MRGRLQIVSMSAVGMGGTDALSPVATRVPRMRTPNSPSGDLTLGHMLSIAGLDLDQVVILRHTYTADGLASPAEVTAPKVLDYARRQGIDNKLGKTPPFIWLNFMTDGGRRSRFLYAYENHGELLDERTDDTRYFDLRPSSVLSALNDRLVIEWSKDAVNWAKRATTARGFPVLEVADPRVLPFVGFDRVLLTHHDLQGVIEESRYAAWRTALGAVQGIYLIADTSTGKLYVGKADGGERILGRWTAYAKDGHGGNTALRELAEVDFHHREHFKFSILRVFGPQATSAEIDEAESYYKQALLTRQYGLNRN